jgi:teichuronic acid biosynthesis glycosyltransferase TuaC
VQVGPTLTRRRPTQVTDTRSAPEHAANGIDLPGLGLHVLAVTNMWPTSGSHRGIFVRDQVESLRTLGVDVDVEVVGNDRGSKDYLLAAPRVRAQVRGEALAGRPYDVVHVHYGLTSLATRFAGAVPKVLTFYGSDVNSPVERRLSRVGVAGVKRRIYVSARLARAFGDTAGQVIPNGVDFRAFAPGDRVEARTRLGIDEHEQVVLFGGNPADKVKGYDVFTEVLAALRARGLPVRELLLSSPGQPMSEVVAKLDASDCLLFCSRYGAEGSPTVVKEATAMGLPVVSVDVGDVSEILAEVTPSAVVAFPQPWGSDAARAELVATLAARTAAVLSQGSRSDGRQRNAWLDLPVVARRVVAVYRDVIAA